MEAVNTNFFREANANHYSNMSVYQSLCNVCYNCSVIQMACIWLCSDRL